MGRYPLLFLFYRFKFYSFEDWDLGAPRFPQVIEKIFSLKYSITWGDFLGNWGEIPDPNFYYYIDNTRS